jgi:2-oxoisovalerate dehydrogenase E2 component (dihydrolipoyl transacylase)
MTNVQQFHLPDVGEGLTEAEIVTWLVSPGDTVEVNQVVVEIETAKSLVELPSPFAGEVTELHAEPGETVDVGRPIISIATARSAPDVPSAPPAVEVEDAVAEAVEEPKLLVGYGAKETTGRRRRRGARPAAEPAAVPEAATGPVRTKPPVRKLAKVLGVDLASVVPSGPGGVVTRADVVAASEAASTPAPAPAVASETDADEIRIPIKGVRKHTAAAMVSSAFTAPHVSEFVTLDVTATMDLRSRLQVRREFADVRLSPLALVAKAFLRAVERTPSANSRWDEASRRRCRG